MEISNVKQIPEVIVRAMRKNWYSGHGEKRFASVTQLIKPVKQIVLEKRHFSAITQDASDMIWMLVGSAMHKVLEAGEDSNSIVEQRLSTVIDDVKITGGVDFYENGIITDYKFIGVWQYLYGDRMEDWEKQLNMYAYLFREHGYEVNELQVVAIFRDWAKRKYLVEKNYPEQVETISIPLWDQERTLSFMRERIDEIKDAMELPDDLIPECRNKERWQPDNQYAVYKNGGKRAMRVFNSQREAETFKSEHKDSAEMYIQPRIQPPKRCLDYCPVNNFCHFYNELNQDELLKAS